MIAIMVQSTWKYANCDVMISICSHHYGIVHLLAWALMVDVTLYIDPELTQTKDFVCIALKLKTKNIL